MMKTSSSLLLALLLTFGSVANATFAKNASSYLNFQIPHSLYQKDGYPHQIAHFGSHWNSMHADGSMVQTVRVYSNYPKLCHDIHDSSHSNNSTPGWFQNESEKLQPPFVLLVDRGDCTFVEKVRRAQHLGASGVLIADSQCLCEGEVNCTSSPDGVCRTNEPIMADDGSGKDISIPSMLLRKSDADVLKDTLLHKKEPVLVEMRWQFPKFETKVTMDIWYTPIDKTSMYLLTNISKLALAMKDQLQFKPHYYLLRGNDFHCNGNSNTPEDTCYDMCTNNGRYCSVSHGGISGKQVVLESLRRMCIDKHYPTTHFWDYLDHFSEWCHSKDYFSNEDCLSDAFKHSEIDKETIATCLGDSGDVDEDQTNSLLEHALEVSSDYGIVQTPTVLINDNVPMMWQLTAKTVLETLCMGFDHGVAPHVCYQCSTCGDPVACASRNPMKCHAHDGEDQENNSHKKTNTRKKKKGRAWKWMFFLALIAGGGGYVYYKKLMEDRDGMGGGTYSLTDAFLSDTA
jgi:hypothetical protein